MQLKVIKADGTVEEYLHTKVIGTINNALAKISLADTCVAEQLAEAVTYFLYDKQHHSSVTSSEIFSIIKVVLAATGYEEAAVELSEHHLLRRVKRSRIEVISVDIQELTGADLLTVMEQPTDRTRWDKSRIVAHLVTKQNLTRQTARTIASMVEEKIFNMGITLVPASLIKQLVLSDTAAVLRAQQRLEPV